MFDHLTAAAIVLAIIFVAYFGFSYTRDLVNENARMRRVISDREDMADDVANDRIDLRQRLDEAEHAIETMKLARTPDGITAAAGRAALSIDDLYARGGFNGVAQRRIAIANVVYACIRAAISGE